MSKGARHRAIRKKAFQLVNSDNPPTDPRSRQPITRIKWMARRLKKGRT